MDKQLSILVINSGSHKLRINSHFTKMSWDNVITVRTLNTLSNHHQIWRVKNQC